MKTFFTDYKRQNTKGIKGITVLISERVTSLKYKIKYLYLKHIKYPWDHFTEPPLIP